MCEEPAQRPKEAPSNRRRLWDIDERLHCSIIGTCLTIGDLRRIERRLKIEPLKMPNDFQVHGNFVVWAGQNGLAARQMQKLLDRRYAVTIRRFAAAATSEDIGLLWAQSLQDGDIPGPYWALLTHPRTDDTLTMQAFGEVHMLSHLVGAANRADIRRLMSLEGERDELADTLAAARRRIAEQERDTRRLIEQHATELRVLTDRVSAARSLERRVRQLETELAAFATGEAFAALQTALRQEGAERCAATRDLVEERHRNACLADDNARLRQALERSDVMCRALSAECEAIERLLATHSTSVAIDSETAPEAAAEPFDLCGRRIVYVGGRGGTIPHLRALVERFGGTFLHHDGGLEEQCSRLDGLLGQCDAVFCPVDCVSHNACLRAKRACRQRATPFVALRTCSLSAFADGLRHLKVPEVPSMADPTDSTATA